MQYRIDLGPYITRQNINSRAIINATLQYAQDQLVYAIDHEIIHLPEQFDIRPGSTLTRNEISNIYKNVTDHVSILKIDVRDSAIDYSVTYDDVLEVLEYGGYTAATVNGLYLFTAYYSKLINSESTMIQYDFSTGKIGVFQ